MKSEKKRYFLVEYNGIKKSKDFDTLEEVNDLIKKTKNYNNRKYSNYIIGNVNVVFENNKYHLEAHIYKKYTNRMTISDLDNLTSKMDEKELVNYFSSESNTKDGYRPDINIAYFETKNKDNDEPIYKIGVKYIPVLYKDDLTYLDDVYIKRCLYFHASIKDYDFFKDFAKEFSLHHFIGDEVSELLDVVDKSMNQRENLDLVYKKASRLYSKFICEYERDESLSRDKKGNYIISERRLRDVGFFIKNYNIRDSKRKSPLKYNYSLPLPEYIEEEDGQLKLRLK